MRWGVGESAGKRKKAHQFHDLTERKCGLGYGRILSSSRNNRFMQSYRSRADNSWRSKERAGAPSISASSGAQS